jgi:hypothetical protein
VTWAPILIPAGFGLYLWLLVWPTISRIFNTPFASLKLSDVLSLCFWGFFLLFATVLCIGGAVMWWYAVDVGFQPKANLTKNKPYKYGTWRHRAI